MELLSMKFHSIIKIVNAIFSGGSWLTKGYFFGKKWTFAHMILVYMVNLLKI